MIYHSRLQTIKNHLFFLKMARYVCFCQSVLHFSIPPLRSMRVSTQSAIRLINFSHGWVSKAPLQMINSQHISHHCIYLKNFFLRANVFFSFGNSRLVTRSQVWRIQWMVNQFRVKASALRNVSLQSFRTIWN